MSTHTLKGVCRQCGEPTKRLNDLARYCWPCAKARLAMRKTQYRREVLGHVPKDPTPAAARDQWEPVDDDLPAEKIEAMLAKLDAAKRAGRSRLW
jgi:hypothetical protein